MGRSTTRFEQVPLEVVKKIIGNLDDRKQPVESIPNEKLVFEPSSKKSQPYSLPVVPERKTGS